MKKLYDIFYTVGYPSHCFVKCLSLTRSWMIIILKYIYLRTLQTNASVSMGEVKGPWCSREYPFLGYCVDSNYSFLLLSTTCNVKTLSNVPWVDMVSVYNSTWTSLYLFKANRWDLPWCADHSQLWQFSPQIVLIRRRTVGSCPCCYSGLMCSCMIMVSRENLLPMSSTRTKPTSEQQILCVSPLLSTVLHIAEVPLIELLWCNRGNFLSLRKLNYGDILFMI